RRFSPTAISKAIRRKPYRGRVPPLSSPVISPITTNLVSPSCRRFKLTVRFFFSDLKSRLPNSAAGISVTAWGHIFSDHIFSDNIFSN
ncbi:hypothetical protein HID58_002058, partial [Brassica napus]